MKLILHPRLRYAGPSKHSPFGRYEFIPAAHGDLDFRVTCDSWLADQVTGEIRSMTEDAAKHWANQWAALHPEDNYRVQVRVMGVTDWEDIEPLALTERRES